MEAKYLEEKGEYIKTILARKVKSGEIALSAWTKSSETFWEIVNTQDGLSGSLLHDSQIQVLSSTKKGKNSLKKRS